MDTTESVTELESAVYTRGTVTSTNCLTDVPILSSSPLPTSPFPTPGAVTRADLSSSTAAIEMEDLILEDGLFDEPGVTTEVVSIELEQLVSLLANLTVGMVTVALAPLVFVSVSVPPSVAGTDIWSEGGTAVWG